MWASGGLAESSMIRPRAKEDTGSSWEVSTRLRWNLAHEVADRKPCRDDDCSGAGGRELVQLSQASLGGLIDN